MVVLGGGAVSYERGAPVPGVVVCALLRFPCVRRAEARAVRLLQGVGFRVWGLGCGVYGVGCRVRGVGCRV